MHELGEALVLLLIVLPLLVLKASLLRAMYRIYGARRALTSLALFAIPFVAGLLIMLLAIP